MRTWNLDGMTAQDITEEIAEQERRVDRLNRAYKEASRAYKRGVSDRMRLLWQQRDDANSDLNDLLEQIGRMASNDRHARRCPDVDA